MNVLHIERAKSLRKLGAALGRDGMSERVIAAVKDFDGESYKGAMQLAGRLKAIAQMAKCDDYWDEQVDKGFVKEQYIPLPPSDYKGQ